METATDPVEIIKRIESLHKRIGDSNQRLIGNLNRLNLAFSRFLKDKYGYTEECFVKRHWRIHHSETVAGARELLTREYSEDLLVKDLLNQVERDSFKEKLFSAELPKEVKQALVICALDEGKFWSGLPHTVIQGIMEKEIGGDPFEGEFSAPCPACGVVRTHVYKSDFSINRDHCGSCYQRYSIQRIQESEDEEKIPLEKPIHKELDYPREEEWNELKALCEKYVCDKVSEAKERFLKDSRKPKLMGLPVNRVKIDSLDIEKLIPNKNVLMNLSESEFIGIYKRVYEKVQEICNSEEYCDEVVCVGGFTNHPLTKKSVDDFVNRYNRELNTHLVICGSRWSDEIVNHLIIDLGLSGHTRVVAPIEEWNEIRSFLSSSPKVDCGGFVRDVESGYKSGVEFPKGLNAYNVNELRGIDFTLSEERLFERFGEVIDLRERIQKEKEQEEAKVKAERRAIAELEDAAKTEAERLGSRLLFIHSSMTSLRNEIVGIVESEGIKVKREIRLNSRNRQGLLDLIYKVDVNEGDIVLLGRGGGDLEHETFNAFKNPDSVRAIKYLQLHGAVVVMGVGMKKDKFPIDSVVDYCEDNFRYAARKAARLVLES